MNYDDYVEQLAELWMENEKSNQPLTFRVTARPDPVRVANHYFPPITEVIFNEESKTTVIRWDDGVKTIVHCGEGETFDRYTGFMAAVCKRLFGSTTHAKKLMNDKDRKYQASLLAAKEEKEKAKRIAAAEEAHKRAEKRHAKNLSDWESFLTYAVMSVMKNVMDAMRGTTTNKDDANV